MRTQVVSRRGDRDRLTSATATVVERLEARRLLAAPVGAGYPDLGIGLNGGMNAPNRMWDDNVSSIAGHSRDVAQLPDGRFLVVGEDDRAADWGLARYLEDGTLDPSFDADGLVFTDFGLGKVDLASDVVLLPDGRFIVAGTITSKTGRPVFGLARYLSDGSLDPTFGRGGKAVADPGVAVAAPELFILPDGRLLLAGGGFLAAFTADGTTDATFGGGDGLARVAEINGIDRQADGKLIVYSQADGAARVYRYHDDGSADASFGVAGVVTLPLAPVTELPWSGPPRGDVAVAADGTIAVSMTFRSEDGYTQPALWRLRADGALDDTFGADGFVHPYVNTMWADAVAGALVIQGDGKILQSVMGTVYRYNADGSRDVTWAGGNPGDLFHWSSPRMVLAPTQQYERLLLPAGSLGLRAVTSDTSPYAPYARPSGPVFRDPDTGIVTITGTENADIIRVFDELDYVSIIVNDWEHNYIFGDSSVTQLIINGGAGNDLIVIGGGYGFGDLPPAYVSGGDGNDTIVGSDAPDSLNGNAGKDSINGGGGNDRLAGNGGHDQVIGNIGGDRVYGDAGNDLLEAGTGNDRLYGGANDDILAGGAGSDTMYGGDGDDIITGGGGTDKAYELSLTDQIFGITTKTFSTPTAAPPPPRMVDELDALLA